MDKIKELKKEIVNAECDICSAKGRLKKAENRLETLNKKLEELEKKKKIKKPTVRINISFMGIPDLMCIDYDITRYTKYSDRYIEFEALGYRYRYIKANATSNHVYPCPRPEYIFELYDDANAKYKRVDYIECINLLEGVAEYEEEEK